MKFKQVNIALGSFMELIIQQQSSYNNILFAINRKDIKFKEQIGKTLEKKF